MYNEIKKALDNKFIFTDEVARILSISIEGRKNCLLWGDGGHAKSSMAQEAIDGINLSNDCFIQSFGEGMDEAKLWGGLNYEKLETEYILEYNVDRSFLNSKVAIFEELFDAPPVVLLALKDTLTARQLRNGAQRFDMKTDCIIALTNRNPQEISDMGAAAHALVERFPLQLNVKWDKYDGNAFTSMFNKTHPSVDNELSGRLSFMIDRAIGEGAVISPRTAVHALESLVIGLGQGLTEREAFHTLAFIPGFEPILKDIDDELAEAEERRRALDALDKVHAFIANSEQIVAGSKNAVTCLKIHNKLESVRDDLSSLRVPDNLVEKRDDLRDKLTDVMKDANIKSLELAGDDDDDLPIQKAISEMKKEETPDEEESDEEESDEDRANNATFKLLRTKQF